MISSRTLLLFLIALNLLALAWWSGALQPLIGSVREPGRLESQIEPDSLELIKTSATAQDGTDPVRASGVIARPDPVVSQQPEFAVASDSTGRAENQPRPSTEIAAQDRSQVVIEAESPPTTSGTEPDFEDDLAADTSTTEGLARVDGADGIEADPLNPDTMPAASVVRADLPDPPKTVLTVPTGAPANGLPEPPDQSQWQLKGEQSLQSLPLVAAALSGLEPKPESDAASQALACRRFSGLSYVAAREVEADLTTLGIAVELRRIDKGDFLVYIEPLASLQMAKRKQSQLRRLGVQDLHIIRAGFYRHAISLGMLRNAELASHHKRSMSELGVGPMQIGPVNVLSARYDITVKADPATMDDRIMRHEVLAVTPGRSCDQ